MAKSEAQLYAEKYGYQLAFLKSDKELYDVFLKAMKQNLDATEFVNQVRNTRWFKTHSETYRQNLVVKTTDPATYTSRLNGTLSSVRDLGTQMGVGLSTEGYHNIAELATLFGWNDNQIRDSLSRYVKAGSAATGEAGQVAQKIKETAYRNGVKVSEDWIKNWQQKVAAGNATVEDAQKALREHYGSTLAPGFKKELQAGMDLYDIAQPYMQSMASALELNPADIDLFDPTIRKALGTSADNDGQPGSVPLWQFEQGLRHDPRWLKTKNAQDSVMGAAKKVLADFGQIGN
ncbi:MAG TPA: hypothetical protein VK204_05750 [Nocardioidaceae bacterium]|nr:hypothetical protein [Nocardioidaceae bacterium]